MHLPAYLAPFQPRMRAAMAGYNRERFLKDAGAGFTVGIVALPLAMAFAIASGLKPEAGIWTAIIAGCLISALGGSAVQIGGPAGAFIVIVYGIVERYGIANLLYEFSNCRLLKWLPQQEPRVLRHKPTKPEIQTETVGASESAEFRHPAKVLLYRWFSHLLK